MKLTAVERKFHLEAVRLVERRAAIIDPAFESPLSPEEFVLRFFHEGADHDQGAIGAFATPLGLARDMAVEIDCARRRPRVLDLCAGIGRLAAELADYADVTCVERDASYVQVGRFAVPSATWHCADAFMIDAWWNGLPFDYVISNPPFGRTSLPSAVPNACYTGSVLAYRFVELAARLAPIGVFLLPQNLAPFCYSGVPCFKESKSDAYMKFRNQTGIDLEPSCGIDTSSARDLWRGTRIATEVVVAEFEPALRLSSARR